MIKIYKMTDDHGSIYVGSTSQKLSQRLSGHKRDKTYAYFDYKSARVQIIEDTTQEFRFERENFWIKELKAINKSIASQGPVGFKNSPEEIERKSKQFKLLHDTRPDIITKAREKSLTPEKQRARSMLSHEARWKRMPEWFAVSKETGEKFGPFKGNHIAKDVLKIHETTLVRCLLHGMNNRRYNFIRSGV